MGKIQSMATAVGNQRIERLLILLDIKSISAGPLYLGLAIKQFIRTILQTCSKDGSVLWSFKLFDSSISPFSSRTRVEKLLGKWATHVRFDSALCSEDVDSNFTKLGFVLKSIHDFEGQSASGPNVDYVVRAIQELFGDYTWDPLLVNDGSTSDEDLAINKRSENHSLVKINSNIVMLFSSFPKCGNQMNGFLNMSPSDCESTTEEFLSKILVSKFQFLQGKFQERNIRPFWIDTNTNIRSPGDDLAFQSVVPASLRRIGWGLASLDSLSLGSVCVPHSLMLSFISQSRFGQSPYGVYGTLRLQMLDKESLPCNASICKVNLIPVNNAYLVDNDRHLLQLESMGYSMIRQSCSHRPRFLQKDAKLRLTVIALLPKRFAALSSTFDSSECYFLKQYPKNKPEIEDNDDFRNRLLQQFQENAGDFEPGKPIFHLLLSSIAREQCVAVLHAEIKIVSSNQEFSLLGVLEPLTLCAGIFRMAEYVDELIDLSFHQAKSISFKGTNMESPGNVSRDGLRFEKLEHLHSCKVSLKKRKANGRGHLTSKKAKVCMKEENQFSSQAYKLDTTDYNVAWSSYIKFLELENKYKLDCPFLEDRKELTTRCMRAYKCWLRQEKKKLKSLLEGQTHDLMKVLCQDFKVKKDKVVALSMMSKDKVMEGTISEECNTQSESKTDAVSVLTINEAHDYIESLAEKLDSCLDLVELDIQTFASRAVRDSLRAIEVLAAQSEHVGENADNESGGSNGLNTLVLNRIRDLLLKSPKVLTRKYKNCTFEADQHGASKPSTAAKVREYLLQIKLRLEIILAARQGQVDHMENKHADELCSQLTNEICMLLDGIQFNLPGGIFGEDLLDFSNRVIRSRYCDSLPEIIENIYFTMEFSGFTNTTADVMPTSEEIPLSSKPCKNSSGKLEHDEDSANCNDPNTSGNSNEVSFSSSLHDGGEECRPIRVGATKQFTDVNSVERRLKEAKERRERARRFSHFQSGAQNLLRVRTMKQHPSHMPRNKPKHQDVKEVKVRGHSSHIVLETPMPSINRQPFSRSNLVHMVPATPHSVPGSVYANTNSLPKSLNRQTNNNTQRPSKKLFGDYDANRNISGKSVSGFVKPHDFLPKARLGRANEVNFVGSTPASKSK